MTRFTLAVTAAAALAACGVDPSPLADHAGARNLALRTAARAHDLPIAWLAAIGYQQGRFEAAEATDPTAPPDMGDAADALAGDTPVDEADAADPSPAPADDGAATGTDAALPPSWGVMYLTDDQVAAAAQLTGRDADAIRTDVAANIDAAAALIEAGWAEPHTDDGLRAATASFLGLADPDDAQLALGDLDDVVRDGFDLTTADGEELELVGTSPEPTAEPLAGTLPGHMPPFQWIPSPNFSSRLGYPIRYIVIHDIEGTMAGAISVFRRSSSQASAHYIVRARDGHIVKMVYEHDNAWHAGHGWFNRHSIGIEHEGFAFRKDGGGYYTDRQYRASAALACSIAHRYDIPVDRKHIFGHFNVPSNLASHTLCSDARGIVGACGGVDHHMDPGRYWNWTKYMSLVRSCVAAAK